MPATEPRAASGNRMKAKFALTIKSGTLTQERAYELASQAVGRALVPGFGLSTCTHEELIKVIDAVTRSGVGGQGSEVRGRRSGVGGQRPERQRAPKDPPNVVRLATLESLQLLRTLVEQLRWSTDECNGYFGRACGAAHPRTQVQVQKAIECCKAVIARRRVGAGEQGCMGAGEQGAGA